MPNRSQTATTCHSSAAALVVALVSFCWLALCAPVLAQPAAASAAGTKLLEGRELTEDNLVNALEPPLVLRGVKVARDHSESLAPRRPSASLLITFETNSAALTAASRDQLDVVAAALANDRLNSYSFVVEGHADPRGNADWNRALSQQRAESVLQYLVSMHGIDARRLTPVGKGDSEPLNRRDIAAPENRRVAIVTQLQ